ncbi:very short patch repair endonuclease [Desulfosarcina ovata subsp. sediminis]|uniref:Very short patch repair endonuclease n=2 Tax=Desulfosarcina ovata TaxID=83564 RepID=A0A5K7ZJM8_9BACT|nr:very short patch repair endonuclease [Desulfosarcina ovata subsp. sediminis]
MSRIQGKNTKPELILRKALWACGMRYRLKSRLPGRPDLYFPGKKLAVFVDGCFWHGCPDHCQAPKTNHSFWQKKLSNNKERDKEVNLLLKNEGWRVLRFWEHEVKNDLDGCIERIAREFQSADR